jgi:pimeloyl-ACP methyl ester carboxylesterase
MPDIATHCLETPEVNLHYTVCGMGPILLILQGGAGNADGSEALANELADRFTVVTYDRRGLSRSTLKQFDAYEIATHAADAARLIAALSPAPVFVFGSSIGALIGLELAAHHAACVRLLIAHEPPMYRLLEGDEREEALRSHIELQEVFRREGVSAAMKIMLARSGVDFNDREADVPAPVGAPAPDPQAAAQRLADLQHFLAWDVPAVTRYQPDVAALTAARRKIIPAIGAGSPSTRPYRCTVVLAERLGVASAEFPGGHTGYVLRPRGFAARLAQLFETQT